MMRRYSASGNDKTQVVLVAVTLLHGTGKMLCDDHDEGLVEFSIVSGADGQDMTRRGKMWGDKKAVVAAMSATKIVLILADSDEMLLLDVRDLDRDGGAFFTVLQTDPV